MSPVNTTYMNTGGAPTGFSNQSQIAGSQSTFANLVVSALTATGGSISGGAVTATTLTATSTTSLGATFRLPSFTTTSATSLTMADNQLSIMSVSVGSAILAFRSGATVYQFIADKANL